MKLLEFISWCKLKGLVNTHIKLVVVGDDEGTFFRIVISDDDHRVTIMYRMLNGRARVVSSRLHEYIFNENPTLQKTHTRVSLRRIQELFIPNEH